MKKYFLFFVSVVMFSGCVSSSQKAEDIDGKSDGESKEVNIKSFTGKFVGAELNAGATLIATKDTAQAWETFLVINLLGNKIQLKATNGKFVCADLDKGGQLFANRDKAEEWETFLKVELPNGKIALKASNGKFVCADYAANGILIANRDKQGDWESFTLEKRK